jgi:hypothetical protein
MLSLQSREHASVLRMLLNDGELATLDPVALAPHASLPFETAVRIALADLEHLTDLTEHGHDVRSERWRQLAADLGILYGRAVPGR